VNDPVCCASDGTVPGLKPGTVQIMRLFAEDSFYCYYRCDACGRELMVLKDDYPGRIEDGRANDP
jgi:hypothetical protein